jgi:L-glutamine---4-(methylsulfanyl)-2-oxobutanoate aminotransferase
MKSFEQSQLLQSLPQQFFASLVKKVKKAVDDGHDIINLGQGNPDSPTPKHIVDRLKVASEHPTNHKYPPFRGHDYLKEAVSTFYKREYDVDIDPYTEVAVLFGGKGGLVEIPPWLSRLLVRSSLGKGRDAHDAFKRGVFIPASI